MAYGEPIEDIQADYDEAAPVVKQSTSTYTKGDTYANALAKGATVVEQEESEEAYGESFATVNANAPVVEQSVDEYEGLVDAIAEPTVTANVVAIPTQAGVVYVDADTYDLEPEEGEPVIDVLTGTVELDDTQVTELNVLAVPDEGYTFDSKLTTTWAFAYEA